MSNSTKKKDLKGFNMAPKTRKMWEKMGKSEEWVE